MREEEGEEEEEAATSRGCCNCTLEALIWRQRLCTGGEGGSNGRKGGRGIKVAETRKGCSRWRNEARWLSVFMSGWAVRGCSMGIKKEIDNERRTDVTGDERRSPTS